VVSAPAKVLVRAPTWLGDVVMTTPVLRALRSAHPQAEIVLEGRPGLAELVKDLPTLDAFLPDPEDGWLARARRLRAQRFDWAVLLPDSVRAAAGPWLARIPVRIGYARDPLRRLMLTHALEPPRQGGKRLPISMLERYLRLTRTLGCPDPAPLELELPVDPAAASAIFARLEREGVARDARLLIVTPGASFGASKLWPPEHFARACDGIAREHGLVPVLAPGPGEEELARQVLAQLGVRGVALTDPPARLPELVALIDRASLVLTNDTGPRHVAVARGCPTVVLMGPTDPRHTAHLLERQRVLREPVECSPCHLKVCPVPGHPCMTKLAPERAVAAARELLA